jgi:hypothetical protein
MSDREAQLKVVADVTALLAAFKALPAAVKPPAEKIEKTLSGAIVKWIQKSGKEVAGFATRTGKAFAALRNLKINKDGFLSALHAMDVKAYVVAKKIGNYFKDAFKGAGKGGNGLGKGGVAMGTMAGNLGTMALAGSVSAGTDLVKEANKVYEQANRISISSRAAGGEYADPKQLTNEFFDVAKNVKGITAEAAADAAAKFVSLTGDLSTARSSMKDFAIASTASGAELGDVAEAVASISTQFATTDPTEIREVLAALIYQGKAGAFELKDAAGQFQRLAASGAAFGIPKNAQGVKTLGGLTQIARTGTGSGEQAATAVENLLTNLKVKSDDLKKAGVKVYDKKGNVRDLPSVLTEAISKVGGKSAEKKNAGLATIFGEQGVRAINPLVAKYNSTYAGTSGTDAQKTAAATAMLKAEFDKAINAAGTWTDVMGDSERAQATSTAKLVAAYEEMKAAVADRVVPRLAEFADQIAASPETIDAFVSAMGLAVDALQFFVDFLHTTGLIKDKTDAQKADDLRKEAKKAETKKAGIDKQIAEGGDPKKLAELALQSDKLDREASTARFKAAEYDNPSAGSGGTWTDSLGRVHENGTDASGNATQVKRVGRLQGLIGDKTRQFEDIQYSAVPPSIAAPGGVGRGQSKVDIANEVKVRIMNPQELKFGGAAPASIAAPTAPGYTRGG